MEVNTTQRTPTILCLITLSICAILVKAQPGVREPFEPKVQLGKTTYNGLVLRVEGSKVPVYAFRGIYYAAPPTGKNRFALPEPRRAVVGDYDATKYGPLCPQNVEYTSHAFKTPLPVTDTSEDCLTLDIYTPNLDPNRAPLTVMVWIHSGGFNIGGGSLLDGTALAAFQNVIVVTLNYRLGALGFLSTGDNQARGNWGLHDQIMALGWVYDNIKKFGGNGKQITIVGESAGAVSVALHYLSPLSSGHFQRGIAQSGTAISHISMVDKPRMWANALAEVLLCSTDQSRKLVECLRGKTIEEILHADIDRKGHVGLIFTPVVDNSFLKSDPFFLLSSGRFLTNDFMVGFNQDGMGYDLMRSRGPPGLMDDFKPETFRVAANLILQSFAPGDTTDIVDAVEGLYYPNKDVSDESTPLEKLLEASGDCLFVAPAVATVDAFSAARARTYMYEFRQRPSFSTLPSWVGADHGEDEYFLGLAFLGEDVRGNFEFTTEEKRFSHVMMSYWANFAKFGDPNGKHGRNNTMTDIGKLPYWPRYFPREKLYLKLESKPSVGKNIKPEKIGFWNKLFAAASQNRKRHEEL
ncbi:carboxylesterase 5A-like [Amphiura filiformis]|uniref:carboxylesterase 5A-like n=1 Tax=Amphiura filiformis TaxID=82378 RepID=UPI003B21555D